MAETLIASLALVAWLYLIAFHGGFWRFADHDSRLLPEPLDRGKAQLKHALHVIAIVPARDEAQVIDACLASLLRQDFSGRFEVVLVDDDSSDGTGAVARGRAEQDGAQDRLTIIRKQGLASGWTGKLAAIHRGFEYVRGLPSQPDFILFCDADIALKEGVVSRLVAGAQARGAALTSLMVKLRCESWAEQWMVPAFIFFFQMIYPFSRVNDPLGPVSAAAGGVMLIRPEALAKAGGVAAIRGSLIDDCAMGALLKGQGPIWLGLTDDAFSLRPYPAFSDIEKMITRSAYAQLRYSPAALLFAVIGMALVFVAPPLIAIFGSSPAQEIAIVATLIMIQSYMPAQSFYGLSRARAFGLPLVAACYTWFTLVSAWRHSLGRGGDWKGRYQASAAQEFVEREQAGA